MTIDDAKAVAEIQTASWQFAYKGIVPQDYLDVIDVKKREENWAKGMIEDPTIVRLVACEDNDHAIGFICGLHNRDKDSKIDSELWAIYICPQKIKNGIGEMLFTSFVTELKSKNFSTMKVWVLEENKIGRSFYEKMGGTLSTLQKEIEIGGAKLKEVSYEYKL
jgi:GNAT superfamily N-acetyltransferase